MEGQTLKISEGVTLFVSMHKQDWIHLVDFLPFYIFTDFLFHPRYWDTLTPYHIMLKFGQDHFYFLMMSKKCLTSGNQRRPISDAASCGI